MQISPAMAVGLFAAVNTALAFGVAWLIARNEAKKIEDICKTLDQMTSKE